MAAVVAGWFAGYAMAMISTVALVFLAVRFRMSPTFERWFPREVPGALLAVPIFTGAVVGWTVIGVALGAAYDLGGFEDNRGALGSPSLPFTAAVLAVAWLPLPILVLVGRRYWWLWAGMSAAFAGLFGWMMPVLASR
jgi:hypothetical protein